MEDPPGEGSGAACDTMSVGKDGGINRSGHPAIPGGVAVYRKSCEAHHAGERGRLLGRV